MEGNGLNLNKNFTIAILYICTGKYCVFWEEFYESYEENFLTRSQKHYFVFTDAENIPYQEKENVTMIPQKNLGWPDNTLKRFELFTREEERWKDYDYTFFINANFLCVEPVTEEEFLPIEQNLLVAEHASMHGKSPMEMTYDRNPKCTACVYAEEGSYYVMGGLNGGKTAAYMDMVHQLKRNVEIDENNGVMALWHDESHLNRFIIGRTDVKVLPPSYGYPEGADYPYQPKMLIREKSRYFDVDAVKAGNWWGRVKLYVFRIRCKLAIGTRLRGLMGKVRKEK